MIPRRLPGQQSDFLSMMRKLDDLRTLRYALLEGDGNLENLCALQIVEKELDDLSDQFSRPCDGVISAITAKQQPVKFYDAPW